MGFAFDHTGSYRVPLAGLFVAMVLAAAQVGRLGPYRFGVKGWLEWKQSASGAAKRHSSPS
jgi:hypothetical protein